MFPLETDAIWSATNCSLNISVLDEINAPKACSEALLKADCLDSSSFLPLPLAVMLTSLLAVCENVFVVASNMKNIGTIIFKLFIMILILKF